MNTVPNPEPAHLNGDPAFELPSYDIDFEQERRLELLHKAVKCVFVYVYCTFFGFCLVELIIIWLTP